MKKTKNTILKAGKCLLVFCVLFSQMSFPFSVLAEELSTQEVQINEVNEIQIDEINEEQVLNIQDNLSDTTNETTSSESIDRELETPEQIDDFDSSSTDEESSSPEQPEENPSDILPEEGPTPEGDNSENEEEIPSVPELNPIVIELIDEFCLLKGNVDTTITKEELTLQLENITKITDTEGNEVEDTTAEIQNGFKVSVTTEEEITTEYQIVILGDYNNDGLVSEEDKELMLETLKETLSEEELETLLPIVDLNQDKKFDILDVTYPVFTENSWTVEKEATDELISYLEPEKEEIYTGEEIKVTYNIIGFNIDTLVGFEGNLNYNKELLELTNIEVAGMTQDITELENGRLVYLLENYNTDGVLITLTFKALSVGTPEISINNLVASLGGIKANLFSENVSTSFNILEGKGGDVELEEEETEDTTTTVPETTVTQTPVTTTPVRTQTVARPVYVALSSDNSIKSLTIKGYEISFDPNTYEYSIKVKNSVKSLDLTVVLNDDAASYTVSGNENFKVGKNTVTITVKAEDGTTKDYIIKVTREKKETVEEEEEVNEEKSSSKTVIIILIVLVIIGLIYVIFKDDEEDSKESKNKK